MRDKGAGGGVAAAAAAGGTQKALDATLLTKAVAHVEHLLESPDWVLDATTDDAQKAAAQARKFVKLFFDAAQARCPARVQQFSSLGPRGLVVKGFSNEQIWEELEVQNIPLRRHLRSRIAKVAQGKVSLKGATGSRGGREEKDRRKGAGGGDIEAEKAEVGKKAKAKKKGSKAEAEAGAQAKAGKAKGKKKDEAKGKASPDESEPEALNEDKEGLIDPFSIEEMNRFADLAEENMRLDEDADESDFGLLEAGSDEEDGEGKTAMFEDFFKTGNEEAEEDEPEEGIGEKAEKKQKKAKDKSLAKAAPPSEEEAMEDEDEEDEEEEDDEEEFEEEAMIDGGAAADDLSDEEKDLEEKLNKLQAKADDGGSDEDDGEDGEGEEEDQQGAAKKGDQRSLYDMDKTLRSLEDEVAKLEEEQLEEKPWMLKGEVSAKQRPLNSLLEIHVEKPMSFFAGRRAEAAVETAGGASEDEAALEDVRGAADLAPRKKLDVDAIVRQRIWDETFDDVVRKFQLPPSQRKRKEEEDVVETLNFEKSRVGLGEIYAKQYEVELLGHKTNEQEKDDKDKAEAKALFGKLMFKLDQLTNAHFTPRPPMLGISSDAVAKVPALKMEETIPLMVSDAHLKAPEEVKAPRRHAREQEELTHDERTAKRRLKKDRRKKELHRKVEAGKMTLSGLRERAEVLNKKNQDAKLDKEKKGTPREARKKIKGSELMAEAQAANAAGVSRKEEQRKERMRRPEGAPTSKKVKL